MAPPVFFYNWRQKFSKSEALACLVIALQRGIEKTANYVGKPVQKTVISSIVWRKTSSENCYFQHCMLRKPVRSVPLLWTRNTSDTENKAYNGENISIAVSLEAVLLECYQTSINPYAKLPYYHFWILCGKTNTVFTYPNFIRRQGFSCVVTCSSNINIFRFRFLIKIWKVHKT